ncbi:MAG: cytochrome c biogenesis protein CcdA [bacterium]|nr:cytochrome c biogenesis protein CcdA [bacterium]
MESKVSKKIVIFLAIVLFAVIALGLFWLFSYKGTVVAGDPNNLGLFWWIFSFAAGLSMIVLPCTLPLAFVIVPLSMGRGIVKGLGMALSFGLGIAITLSLYGVAAALFGKAAIGALGSDAAETIKNWVYFIAGMFALVFALSEIGLMKFRMPTYTGAAPAFIQKKQDYLKALLLGLFLGNVGIGCPHPATPLILVEIASSGDVLYGWMLFLVHAIGRVLPLIFLALLGIMGVNGLSWIIARKDKVERITGWAMVFVAGFILTLGLFSHDWWVNSGIHTGLEKLTQEESLLNIVKQNIGSAVTHDHGMEVGTGLFGLPLWLGNWFLVFLWVFPIWWWWFREKNRVSMIPEANQVKEKDAEHGLLMSREKFFTTLTIVLALIFIYILPHNFLKHEALEGGHMGVTIDENMPHGHDSTGNSVLDANDTSHVMGEEDNTQTADQKTPVILDESMPHGHDDVGNSIDSNATAGGHVMTDGDMMMGNDHIMSASAQLREEGEIIEGLVVNSIAPKNPGVGVPVKLQFFVNEKLSGKPVDDLEISHEKYIHVIGMRDDLTQFFHLHPKKTKAGTWEVLYTFTEGGTYKIWSDIKQGGTAYTFGHTKLSVFGKDGSVVSSTKQSVDFLSNTMVGDYQVAFSHGAPLVKGREETIRLAVKNLYGNGVELESYLGAPMHLVLVKDDLSEYVHTHPGAAASPGSEITPDNTGHDDSDGHHGMIDGEESQLSEVIIKTARAHGGVEEPHLESSELPFSVTFPTEGVYKLFAQFRPKDANLAPDEAIRAEFYVKVAKEVNKPVVPSTNKVDPQARWWTLFISSIILMSLLSYGVHRFLQVK